MFNKDYKYPDEMSVTRHGNKDEEYYEFVFNYKDHGHVYRIDIIQEKRPDKELLKQHIKQMLEYIENEFNY